MRKRPHHHASHGPPPPPLRDKGGYAAAPAHILPCGTRGRGTTRRVVEGATCLRSGFQEKGGTRETEIQSMTAQQRIRLDFLGPGHFAREIQIYGYWKSLDFLGFSRPNRDLSMRCAGFSREEFFSPLLSWRAAGAGGAAAEVMRMRRIIHKASLARFLLFVNRSSPL